MLVVFPLFYFFTCTSSVPHCIYRVVYIHRQRILDRNAQRKPGIASDSYYTENRSKEIEKVMEKNKKHPRKKKQRQKT